MKKNRSVVNGFAFTDRQTAQKALKEAESIQYVKEKLDMENPRMVLEMYRKLVKEKVFETPVGMIYLKQLQDYLFKIPEIKGEGLEPIQAGSIQNSQEDARAFSAEKNTALSKKRNIQQQKNMPGTSDTEEMAEWYEEQLDQEKQKRRAAELKQRQTEGRLKNKKEFFRFSIILNVFLVLVVVGMLVITLMDNTPNIIDYENKIVDKYVEWERELEQREENIKKWEQELGL